MASVVKKIKRKRNNSQEFQITASVNALTLECRKDVWVPEKLVILWNKEDGSSHTKPVPWQPGLNNPFRGIHVWPEEDPVKFISTVHKNIKREGTYEDHPWEIIIKNETKKGNRRTIAFGLLDLSDYIISKEERTMEITVTLRPVNKNIVSGSIEFKLTSVLLEDGVPYRNREEELREILEAAVKTNSANKRAARKAKSVSQGNLSAGDKIQVSRTVPVQEQSKAKEKGLQAGAVSKPDTSVNRKGGVRKDERRKAPLPPRPRLPPPPPPPRPHTIPGPASSAVEKKCGSGERKSFPIQGSSEEQPSKNSKTSSPPSQKGKKKKNKAEYPRELNPFPVSSSEDERSSSSEDVLLTREKNIKGTTGAAKKEDGEKKVSQNRGPSPPQGHNKRRSKKKLAKYPKALNPFASSSDEESVESPSKEARVAQHSSATTVQLKGEKQKVSDTEARTSPKGKKKTPGRKKREKYPKALNPFGGSSDEEVGILSPKAAEMKESSSSEELTGDNEKVSDVEDPHLKTNRQKPCGNHGESLSPSSLVAEKKEDLKPVSTATRDGEEKIPDMGSMWSGAVQTKKEKPLSIEKPVEASGICETSETKPEEAAECDADGEAEKPLNNEKAGKTFVSCDTNPAKPEEAVKGDQCITDGSVDGDSDQASSGDNERPAFTDAISPEFQDNMAEPEAPAVREQSCQETSDAATACDAVGAVSSARGDMSSGVEERPLLLQATISLVAPKPVEVPVSVESYPHDDNADVLRVRSETVPVRQDGGSGADKDLSSSKVPPRQDAPALKELNGDHLNAVTPPRKVPTLRKKAPPKPGRPLLLRQRAALISDKALRNRLELSAYAMEELYPLNKEIDSLRNVIFKVEMELQEAKKTDRKEEYDGLMQDWLILNNHRTELTARKQNLQTLEKSEDLVLCIDIMRSELKLFFEVEDWRKTDHLRQQEASLLNLLVSFEIQRREIC